VINLCQVGQWHCARSLIKRGRPQETYEEDVNGWIFAIREAVAHERSLGEN
jgi:hypothetical protein